MGTGVCSAVFRSLIFDVAPLARLEASVDTQKFRIVKLPWNSHHMLTKKRLSSCIKYKEMEILKAILYHRNVISMPGWLVIDAKPILVFEMANQDLLRYVKGLRTKNREEIHFSTLLSIIWQTSKYGNLYEKKIFTQNFRLGIHSSKCHCDLAARNIWYYSFLTKIFRQIIFWQFFMTCANNLKNPVAELPLHRGNPDIT